MTQMPILASATIALALYLPFCARVHDPVIQPGPLEMAALWEEPEDLELRDLYFGPWHEEHAPDPFAVYRHVEHKHTGVNPGLTVVDDAGREWSVKQAPPEGQAPEGPIEVALSRVLWAVGYRQPPVYYMPSFTYRDDWGTRIEPGGRFRLKTRELKDRGEWSWQRNPFVGTRPHQGLLAILLLFNSSDLKNSNNTLYEHRVGDLAEPWYVVRDLGTALGRTGRLAPRRGDAAAYAAEPFITAVNDNIVEFGYAGWHQELVRGRITVDDVRWAGALLGRLRDRQWREAFLAAGFTPAAAEPFIAAIKSRIAEAESVGVAAAAAADRER